MTKYFRTVAAGVAAAVIASMAIIPAANAHPVSEKACADVEAVFARGSGQNPYDNEATTFATKLSKKLNPVLSTNTYELGSETLHFDNPDGSTEYDRYPAVQINGDLMRDPGGTIEGWRHAAGAKFSSGGKFAYGDSVNAGIAELSNYLRIRGAKCPDARFVLGGYSQGAQVVGETFGEKLGADLRGRIVFNSLFGDPRLNLPEGIRTSLFEDSPACRGEKSIYRRGYVDSSNCHTSAGSLGARSPYLPASWDDATGLWCNGHDLVCGSSWYETSGHGKYADTPMDEAMTEIAARLKKTLPKAAGLQTDVRIIKPGTTGLDVVFLVDSTGSMGGKIEQARTFVSTMSDRIHAMNGRVALVEYKDSTDAVPATILSGLNPETADLQAKLAGVEASGGDDTPEGLLHALMTAFNGLDWKKGATKAAVVLTDAPFHDPDMTDGATMAQVAKRSLEIDPVNVYPVVPSFLDGDYAPLAEATSGKVIPDEGDSAAALSTALTSIEQRPVPLLAMEEYSAPIGATVTFDASNSYAMAGTIAGYEWDVNGDGTFESRTATPVYKHAYPAAFEGVMQVRVTDTLGGVSSASAKVSIGKPYTRVVPLAPTGVSVVADPTVSDGSQVRVEWAANDPTATAWVLRVDGVIVGGVGSAERSAMITDVRRSADVDFEVQGVSSTDEMGAAALAVLPAIPGKAPEVPPVTPPKPTDPPAVPSPKPTSPGPSTPAAAPTPAPTQTLTRPAPVGASPVSGMPVALAGTVQQAGSGEEPVAATPTAPASTPAPKPAEAQTGGAATSPPQAPPAAAEPRTPAADFGPWPWILGILVILGVAAVSLVYRRRNSA